MPTTPLASDGAAGPDRLSSALTAEAAGIRRFVELLREQQQTLVAGDTAGLPDLSEKMGSLAADVNGLTANRNALLAGQGCTPDRAGMDAWCGRLPAGHAAAAVWSGILSLAAEARELNLLNGELIRMRMQYTDKALDILLRKDSSLDLYGPDGQSAAPGGRRIDDAV